MIQRRDLAFGLLAVVIVVGYLSVGSRVAPLLIPPSSPTPTPTKPVERVSSPAVNGTLVFAIRGDVYVLSAGGYVPLTSEGRSHEPNISADGRTVIFTRVEEIDGKRIVDDQVVPAHLRFSDVVTKDARGGTEKILVTGLIKAASGFHEVTWFDSPALSPDGKRVAVVADDGKSGASDLELYDAQTGKRTALLSQGSNLADPAWSPDGKTIAVTSYTLGNPRILLVPADGRPANPVKITTDGEPYRPAYSSDGNWILYTLRHEGRNDIHAVQVSGGKDVALTSDGKSWNGVFSPDGKQLAFLREHDGLIDLFVMDLADALSGGSPKNATKLTRGEGIDGASRPAWGS
jgi:Lipoprotein LpqB beta-propeller domain/WD40-like Beta Propeller Repeat